MSAALDADVAAAMPGARSVKSANNVADELHRQTRSWSASSIDYAERLQDTAETYDENDRATSDHFTQILISPLGNECTP